MVFSHPIPSQRAETVDLKRSLSETSDIAGVVRAYDRFWELQTKRGWKAAKTWARKHHVNPAAMVSLRAIRMQLLSELCSVGLVEQRDVVRGDLRRGAIINRHGDCELLVGALWCTAGPGNLASRNRVGSFGLMATALEGKARLHPSSVLFHRKPPADPSGDPVVLPEWYSYRNLVQTSDVFLRDCSSMLPEQILLFGGSTLEKAAAATTTDANHDQNLRGILDEWIAIESSSEEGEDNVHLLIRARETIEAILERKLLHLSSKHPQRSKDQHDFFLDGIRRFFDDLESGRIPEHEPRAPSNDFHDYFLEENEAEV